MTSKKIRFSHKYLKMLDMNREMPKEAILLEVLRANKHDLNSGFIDYDTTYKDEKTGELEQYELPDHELIILVFRHVQFVNIIWTTIRRYTPQKYKYYRDRRQHRFEIILEEESCNKE